MFVLEATIAYVFGALTMMGYFVTTWQDAADAYNHRHGFVYRVLGYQDVIKAFLLGLLWPVIAPFLIGGFFSKVVR